MFSRNKEKRTLENRGEEEFKFDFQKEKNIYLYLWRLKLAKKKAENLEGKNKFDKYEDWKQYVRTRHINKGKEQLKEFSRFLNQKIRNLKPNQEYWNIFIPVLATLIIEEGFDRLLENQAEYTKLGFWGALLVQLVLTLIIVIPMIFFIIKAVMPIWDNNTDRDFLEDYKEIIDEIIEEKTGNETMNNDVPQHKENKKSKKGNR